MGRFISLFLSLILFSSTLYARPGFDISGLKNLEMRWDGTRKVLRGKTTFCVAAQSSKAAVTSDLKDTDMPYKLVLESLKGDPGVFQAVAADGSAITLNISLQTGAGNVELKPGLLTEELRGEPVCQTSMALQVKTTGKLDKASAGAYIADLKLRAAGTHSPVFSDKTLDVRITVPAFIGVSGDTVVDLGRFDGRNDLSRELDLCVFRNGGGTYRATLQNASGENSLLMTHASHPERPLAYQVRVNNQIATPTVSGIPASSDRSCAKGGQTLLRFLVLKSDAENVYSGGYTGTLKLSVEVE